MRFAALGQGIDVDLYGGEAARLSIALAAGLPVPHGFALTLEEIRVELGAVSAQDCAVLEEWLHSPGSPVAVRSLALGEDGLAASFAGQHVTVLNRRDLDGMLAAITSVWASGQSDSARLYRDQMGVAREPKVAAIVQALVPSEVVGALFTIDPISGSGKRFVVEAAWGFGDTAVAGLVTPDHYVIKRQSTVIEQLIGNKDVAIRAMSGWDG